MTMATLNLRVSPRRMLRAAEAADYCGRPVKRFRAECPVTPVTFPSGDQLYDMQDLDRWIDSLKGGAPDNADDIIDRLG